MKKSSQTEQTNEKPVSLSDLGIFVALLREMNKRYIINEAQRRMNLIIKFSKSQISDWNSDFNYSIASSIEV